MEGEEVLKIPFKCCFCCACCCIYVGNSPSHLSNEKSSPSGAAVSTIAPTPGGESPSNLSHENPALAAPVAILPPVTPTHAEVETVANFMLHHEITEDDLAILDLQEKARLEKDRIQQENLTFMTHVG